MSACCLYLHNVHLWDRLLTENWCNAIPERSYMLCRDFNIKNMREKKKKKPPPHHTAQDEPLSVANKIKGERRTTKAL